MRRRNSEDPSQCDEARGASRFFAGTALVLTLSDIVPATVLPEAATRLELNPLFAEAWREDVDTLPYQPVEVRGRCFSFVRSAHARASNLLRRTF